MNKVIDSIEHRIRRNLGFQKEDLKEYVLLCIAYFIAYISIIRADYNYADDIGRKFSGYHGWNDWSRWSTMILSNIIHADWYLSDISPLPQLLSCLLMASVSFMLIRLLSGKTKATISTGIASLLCGVCPYFLGCISYKYDSIYMALAIWISVFPVLHRKKRSWKYLLLVIACTLIMCTTYQPAAGIFPMIVALTLLQELIKGEDRRSILKEIVTSVLGFILGMVIFKAFLLKPGDTAVYSSDQFVNGVRENYRQYLKLISGDFRKVWLLLIFLIILAFLWRETRYASENGYPAWKALLFAVIIMTFCLLVMFGVNPILVRFADDTRCMLGVGIFIAAIAIVAASGNKTIIQKLLPILLFWCWFTFSFTYGNAMAEQKRYNEFRMQVVIDDLKDLDAIKNAERNNEKVQIMFIGNAGFSPVLRNMQKRGNILTRLLRDATLGENGSWQDRYLFNYYDLPDCIEITRNVKWAEMPVVKDNVYQTISADNEHIIIDVHTANR